METIKRGKAIMAFAMTLCLMANPVLAALESSVVDVEGIEIQTSDLPTGTPAQDAEQADPAVDAETDAETGTDTDTETGTGTETDAETDAETGTGTDTETETDTEKDAISKQDPDLDAGMSVDPIPAEETATNEDLEAIAEIVDSYELRAEGTDIVTIWRSSEGRLMASATSPTEDAQDASKHFEINSSFSVSGTGHAIVVKDGVQMTLTLNTVELNATQMPAINVRGNASLSLVLNGESTLHGDDGFAAIQVQRNDTATASIEITGAGSLTVTGGAQGAGIGSGYNRNAGNISINVEGTINANGGSGAAGIGGGYSSSDYQKDGSFGQSGDITIDGGAIIAVGGAQGAGIGGGKSGFANKIITSNATIDATGGNGAAGIGAGDHASAEYIEINGGIITATGNGGGAGIGSGLGSHDPKSKGVGTYYANVVINDGTITAKGSELAAGIGGGMYCDGVVEINNGTIDAQSGTAGQGKSYQGGAGIGGGYQGYAQVTINGGSIDVVGGNGAAGIGLGAVAIQQKSENDKLRNDEQHIKEGQNFIKINDGVIRATGGTYAAAIGTGNSASQCAISILGGNITAIGGEKDSMGGAAIGSGVGAEAGEIDKTIKYATDTQDLTIEIGADATIQYAKGGFAAAAIGAGFKNTTAKEITISGDANIVLAVSTGEKFAIDTQRGEVPRADSTNVLQGTFMKTYNNGMKIEIMEDANPSSANGVVVPGKVIATGLELPASYRSFAATVGSEGSYLVRNSNEVYFAFNTDVAQKSETEVIEGAAYTLHYATNGENLSDNYYLYEPKEAPVIETPEPPVSPDVPDRPANPDPDPDPEVDVPEVDVPLTPPDVEIPEVDVPLTPPTTQPDEENITEPEVPLTDKPAIEETVEDAKVPLANLPKTGGADITFALLGLLIIGCGVQMKRKEN